MVCVRLHSYYTRHGRRPRKTWLCSPIHHGATLKRREGSRRGVAGVSATFCTILLCAFCTSFRVFSDVFVGVGGKLYHLDYALYRFRHGHCSRRKTGGRGGGCTGRSV